jgi:hypothetical protein
VAAGALSLLFWSTDAAAAKLARVGGPVVARGPIGMSILTKILMGLTVVAVLPLLYLSAAVLKVNGAWRVSVAQFEKAVEQQKDQNFDRLHGDARARVDRYQPGKLMNGQVGVQQLQTALDTLKLGRGRFWYARRETNSIDAAAGKFKVNIIDENVESGTRQPLKEHGIKDKSFLYAFQLRHDGAPATGDRYVGEFVVDGLTLDANGVPTDSLVPLKPSMPYDAAQWDLLKTGDDNWLIYEHMPLDDHDVFSDLTPEEIRNRVPPQVVDEYLNDGKAPSSEIENNPKLKEFIVEDKDSGAKIFLRPLRDYQQVFRNVALRMAQINDRIVILKKEKEYADRAKIKAEEMIVGLDARKMKLEQEKQVLDRELAVIKSQHEKLAAIMATAEQNLRTRLSENKRLADELVGLGGKTAAVEGLEENAARTP